MRNKVMALLATLVFAISIASGTLAVEGVENAAPNEYIGEAAIEEIVIEEEQEEAEEEKESGRLQAKRNFKLTSFEKKIVEQGFRLLPYDHPFVIAYENTYRVDIQSFTTEINGVELSGVPFEFGGKGNFSGFSDRWWSKTEVRQYPVSGLDCSGFIEWIYYQLGYAIPSASTSIFFSGKSGVMRSLPGIREHLVIPSFDEALVGDVAYNSEGYRYRSGHGSHVQLYLGTANILGISEELKRMYPDFPCDSHLVLECGWSDGSYYYKYMRKLRTSGARSSLAGVGVQFFTSVRQGSEYVYKCPSKVYAWSNPATGNTFKIESRLEAQRRPLQYRPNYITEYTMNLSRPIMRPDVR